MAFQHHNSSATGSDLHLDPQELGAFAEANAGNFASEWPLRSTHAPQQQATSYYEDGHDFRPADFPDLVDDDSFERKKASGFYFRELTPPQPVEFWSGKKGESEVWGSQKSDQTENGSSKRGTSVSPLTSRPRDLLANGYARPSHGHAQRPNLTLDIPQMPEYRPPTPAKAPRVPPKSPQRSEPVGLWQPPSYHGNEKTYLSQTDSQTVISQAVTEWPEVDLRDHSVNTAVHAHTSNAAQIRSVNNERFQNEKITGAKERGGWWQAIARSLTGKSKREKVSDEENLRVFAYFDSYNNTLVAENAHLLQDRSWCFNVVEGTDARGKPALVPRFTRYKVFSANAYKNISCVTGAGFLICFIALVATAADSSR